MTVSTPPRPSGPVPRQATGSQKRPTGAQPRPTSGQRRAPGAPRLTGPIPRPVTARRSAEQVQSGERSTASLRPAASLPMPAPVVAHVVRLVSDPAVEPQELAQVIARDPVLSAEIIAASNSSFLGARSRIASVGHACAFLGTRAVRNLVLCLSVRQLVPASALGGLPVDAFWEASLRRGTAARTLAQRLGLPQPEELFALGLCQDLGLLLACRRSPELGTAWPLTALAARRLQVEEAHGIAGGHPELGWRLLDAWLFPDELSIPVRFHHRPDEAPAPHQQRARVAAAADALSDVFLTHERDTQEAMRRAEQALAALQIPADQLPALVDAVGKDVSDAATLLQLKVSRQPTYQELAQAACQGMFELNLSYEEMTRQLRTALEEKERLAAELKRVNGELERLNTELAGRAATDALTGLPNRRSFDETIARELAKPRGLSLLMLDVDRFKAFNDKHGHQAGDEVLKTVARAIQGSVRASDLAARFGGEEFAVVLPGTPLEGARMVAERIRTAVAGVRLQLSGAWVSVTISVGGATLLAPGALDAAALIARADAALYAAKQAGRNRVMWAPNAG